MANELQLSGSFSFSKNNIAAFARAVTALLVNVSGNGGVYEPGLAISNSGDTTLQLGGLTSQFGWGFFHNLDTANTITLKVVASGTAIIDLQPGEFALFRFGSGISAPVARASAGSPLLEYAILPP